MDRITSGYMALIYIAGHWNMIQGMLSTYKLYIRMLLYINIVTIWHCTELLCDS